ncbi:MAG: hypothetical protein EXS14_09850 [Planctomycetes bacterium]|nr:hypothetical protein [Planctomycetota bacterium]
MNSAIPMETQMEKPRPCSSALPLFLLSAAVLTQELLLVRLIAVPLWHHITYMVVTSALLAFGVAGTVLALAPRLGGQDADGGRKAFAAHSMLFSLATLVSGSVLMRASIDTVDLLKDPALLLPLFGLYLIAGLPLFFGGLAVAVALRHAGSGMARTYFSNLLGSGLGCALFLLLLGPMSGDDLLLFTAGLGLVAGLMAARDGKLRWLALITGVAIIATFGISSVRDLVLPEPTCVASKEINRYLKRGHKVERTLWNPLCRIDVSEPAPSDPDRTKMIFQDGDAPTYLYPKSHTPASETQVPYIMKPELQSLLVIGAGGGRELALAAQHQVPRTVGLEINSSTASLLTEHYREFTGDIPNMKGVELVQAEGRAWLARNPERFDWIQMTGVDTYAALNSGAYVASESYLYTEEAFDAYLEHLNPGGYFSIIRLFFEPDRETLRLYVMALNALQRQGVKDPGQHAVVLRSGAWGILVIGHDPIPAERLTAVRAIVDGSSGHVTLHHDPFKDLGTPFSAYAAAKRAGTEAAYFSAYPFDVSPVDDDSPFFYLYHRWGTIIMRLCGMKDAEAEGRGMHKTVVGGADPWLANTGEIPTGQLVLLGLLTQSLVFGALLVLGPLWILRRRALAVAGSTRSIIYFSCLGLGFMLLEIALAQKLALFLGHPTWSLAIVIGGMLFFSGLGAWTSGRYDAARLTLRAPLVVTALALLLALVLPIATSAWLPAEHPVRCALALLLIAPAAFFMGMPMPSGLRLLAAQRAELVPWAWGVNGVASVAGSILAIVLAMATGFTGVLVLAAALYALAALSRPRS